MPDRAGSSFSLERPDRLWGPPFRPMSAEGLYSSSLSHTVAPVFLCICTLQFEQMFTGAWCLCLTNIIPSVLKVALPKYLVVIIRICQMCIQHAGQQFEQFL
jgi:hypothetical protein